MNWRSFGPPKKMCLVPADVTIGYSDKELASPGQVDDTSDFVELLER